MIWAFIVAAVITSLIVGSYCDRQNHKAYQKGFDDGMAVQIVEITGHKGKYHVEWEEEE